MTVVELPVIPLEPKQVQKVSAGFRSDSEFELCAYQRAADELHRPVLIPQTHTGTATRRLQIGHTFSFALETQDMAKVWVRESSNNNRNQPMSNMKKEEQRLRRRDNQRRYRKRMKDTTASLERETEGLRVGIEVLKRRRFDLSTHGMGIPNVWSVVVKFFRLFHYGFQKAQQSSVYGCFVHDVMVEDLVFNAEHGWAAFRKSWMCTSLRFKDFEMELDGMKKTRDGSLLASTTTSVTITDRTLRTVFPHLCRSGSAAEDERTRHLHVLGDKLLGHRLTMSGSMWFQWDKTLSKVTAMTSTSDMLSPVLELLGTLEDVARVFERATISPDFQWSSRYRYKKKNTTSSEFF